AGPVPTRARVAVDRRVGDDVPAGTADGRRGRDATAPGDTGSRRHVVVRAAVILSRRGTANDVAPEAVAVEVTVWTIHVIVVRVIPAERPRVGRAAPPVPSRRHRRPSDVAEARRSDAPRDPRAGVAAPRDPRPSRPADVDPAPV